MNSIKKAFGIAALALGGAGTVWTGSGLLLGGWSTAGQPGGVDLTSLGLVFTVASAGIFYAGYRAVTGGNTKPESTDTPSKDDPAPKP